MKIACVFPTKISQSPKDKGAYFGPPDNTTPYLTNEQNTKEKT